MVLDHIRNRHLYSTLGSGIREALDYCARAFEEVQKNGTFPEGDVEIGGGVVMKAHPVVTHPTEGSVFEAHHRYIDIHFVLWGGESIGYADKNSLCVLSDEREKDLVLLRGEGTFIPLLPGYFMITYPDDAHSPSGALTDAGISYGKIVAKVPVAEMAAG